MELEKRRLDGLRPHPDNVRKHGEKQVKEMAKSVSRFGMIRPIVISEDGEILCGHGLYEALKSMGKEEADVLVMRGITDRQKKKLILADNKIYEMGVNNFSAIDKLLAEFGASSDFDVPGYDADTLESMYGISSIKEEARESFSIPPMPQNTGVEPSAHPVPEKEDEQGTSEESETVSQEDSKPSAEFERKRMEAIESRKTIICPHCGGIIEV